MLAALEAPIVARLEKIPLVARLVGARGWPYLLSWGHRVSGAFLVLFIWFHIYTLSSLLEPASYDAKMRIFKIFIFTFLEWALAIPVIYHALNGGRLILYEGFGNRRDKGAIRWVAILSALYLLLLALVMLLGNQEVSAVFFWLMATLGGLALCGAVVARIWDNPHRALWKLQRITGAYLLVVIPAHLLFMHLSLSVGHDSALVIHRLQNYFIKAVDLSLLLSALFHGGYGLWSAAGDYLGLGRARLALGLVIAWVMALFAWVGIKVVLFI
jgi:succinate dehydrogenase cytochrome b556 subunit